MKEIIILYIYEKKFLQRFNSSFSNILHFQCESLNEPLHLRCH